MHPATPIRRTTGRRTRRASSGATALLLSLLLAASTATAQDADPRQPEAVVDSRSREIAVAAEDGYVAWHVTTPKYRANVYVRTPDGERFKVNPDGKDAALGDIDNGVLVYQEFSGDRFMGALGKGKSRIRFLDLATRKDVTPSWLDTPGWEYLPSLSEGQLFMGRVRGDKRQLIVVDLDTRKQDEIAAVIGRPYWLEPGQINHGWVVWTEWDLKHNAVVQKLNREMGSGGRYASTRASFWAPSVDENGVAYMTKEARRCGTNSRLMREGEVILELPHGDHVARTHVSTGTNGINEVYYTHDHCNSFDADIYKLRQSLLLKVSTQGDGSVTSLPSGIDCGSTCTAEFPRWGEITLTAEPGLLSHFVSWTGICSEYEATCLISAQNASDLEEITATFGLGP